ncbi:MAG: AraC family transcriptional regulator ligand-binding domain-containing protein [Gammaproteobacteria bacterium]|nr:AraC family transcriptional regulator ligand-binding domain-containing protein [Gammaproteobacteria bacterium]
MKRSAANLLARELIAKLTELDLDPESVLAEAGLRDLLPALRRGEMPSLSRSELAALYRACMRAFEADASRRAGRPTMGEEEMDLLCYCIITCPTLREAIERSARFLTAIYRAVGRPDAHMHLCETGSTAELYLRSGEARNVVSALLSDLAAATLFLKLFGWLIGEEIELLEASVCHEQLLSDEAIAELFPHPLVFGRKDLWRDSEIRLTFASGYLQRPVVRSAADLEDLLRLSLLDRMTALTPGALLSDTVRTIFNRALARGLPLPSTKRVAVLCNMSGATLRRHLAQQATSIRRIREECLRRSAFQLLRHSDVPLGDIASRLGFSDVPSFHRAFRRWTRTSPSAYRRSADSLSR